MVNITINQIATSPHPLSLSLSLSLPLSENWDSLWVSCKIKDSFCLIWQVFFFILSRFYGSFVQCLISWLGPIRVVRPSLSYFYFLTSSRSVSAQVQDLFLCKFKFHFRLSSRSISVQAQVPFPRKFKFSVPYMFKFLFRTSSSSVSLQVQVLFPCKFKFHFPASSSWISVQV